MFCSYANFLNPGSSGLKDIKLKNKIKEKVMKIEPIKILVKNNLKVTYLNIIFICNTYRIR